MTDNLLKNDKLAKEILERLSEYAELPKTGFLAGGAVANTIMQMEHGSEYPINDLDVFRLTKIGRIESKKMPHRFLELDLNVDYRGRMFLGENYGRAYTIADSWRSEMKNYIDVEVSSHDRMKSHYRTILEAFDLNCCQAGVDLESEELIYLPSFESFLKTMQLEVTYPCTPFHTTIRVVNKVKELRCFCNFQEQMKYLSQIPLILSKKYPNSPKYSRTQYARYFGKLTYNEYLKNKDEIDKHFEVVKETVCDKRNDVELFTMIPRDSTIIEELRECEDVCSIKTVWGLLQGKKGFRDKNIRAITLSILSRDFVMVNPRYAQCDWDKRHVRQIERFIEQHPFMLDVFCRLKLNIKEQLDAIRVINRMVEKVGLFVIGLVENASQLPENNAITEEWIQSLANNYRTDFPGLLKDPEDLGEFECAQYFSELLTVEDLMGEGLRMHHCVGGYAGAIKDGGSMIFHIEAEGEASTIEISKYGWEGSISGIYLAQHRGVWNKEPSSFHLMIGKRLFEYLEEKMGMKKDFTTTKSETNVIRETNDITDTNDVREKDVNILLARLREGRQHRQEQIFEEVNNP
jgi:hypothetical protein